MTIIKLTDKEAKMFVAFRKYQELFEAMIESKVPELVNGQAVLNFNSDGTLMDIELKQKVYRRSLQKKSYSV